MSDTFVCTCCGETFETEWYLYWQFNDYDGRIIRWCIGCAEEYCDIEGNEDE